MPDQTDFHEFMNLRRAKGHPPPAEGLKAASMSAHAAPNARSVPYDEPSNEELGIEPWTGWRLVTFWLCAGVFSCAVFWGIGEALLAVLS